MNFLARQLSRFIRYNTVSSRSNERFACQIGRILKQSGFRVSYQTKKLSGKTLANVIGIKGKGKRPFLICAHLDTVPPGETVQWTKTKGNPWNATIKNGALYGLGAADDKGPLVAMLCAGAQVSARGLKRPLMLMGTFGEESGMGGAKLFRRAWKGMKPCCAMVCEPTNLGITYRHKGLGVIEIELEQSKGSQASRGTKKFVVEFKGRQGHSSRPHTGDNALEKAMDFLRGDAWRHSNRCLVSIVGGAAANLIPARASLTFQETNEPLRDDLSGPLLACYDSVRGIVRQFASRKDRSFVPPVMTSNFGIAQTKGRVTRLVFDFRLLPGQSVRAICRRLKKTLSHKLRVYEGIKWRMGIERDNPPLGLEQDHPFMKAGIRLLKEEGLPPSLSVKPSCTEAGVYAGWGVPAFVFGPGRSAGNVHAPNESIRISEVEKAVRVYQRAIQAFCVEGKPCS